MARPERRAAEGRPRRRRREGRAAAVALAIAVLLAVASPAAARIVRSPHGPAVSIMRRPTPRAQQPRTTSPPGAQLSYAGGAVLHSSRTEAIYWDPAPRTYSSTKFASLVDRFLADVAHDSGSFGNAYSVMTQYGDGAGAIAYQSSFAGSIDDTTPYPGGCTPGDATDVCVTTGQVETEIANQVGTSATSNSVYFVLLPQKVALCDPTPGCSDAASPGGYCGIHGMSTHGYPYAVVLDDPANCGGAPQTSPNDAGVDFAISTVSHEHIEAITDPNPTLGSAAWFDFSSGNEIADLCESDYAPALGGGGATAFNQLIASHAYDLQEEWSNADDSCDQYYPPLAATFAWSSPLASLPTAFAATDTRNPHASFAWSFGDGATSAGASASHVYAVPGSYAVTLTVTGDAGRSAVASTALGVLPWPPLARIAWSPATPGRRETVRFNAGGSAAPPFSAISSYAWSFGDGATATGPAPAHRYLAAGDYRVALTVTSTWGLSDTAFATIAVGDPAASFSVSGRRRMRQRLTFAARASDPDGRVVRYRWDFGDGRHATGRRVRHVFGQGGTRTVSLAVTDSDGSTTVVRRALRLGYVRPRARVSAPRQARTAALTHGLRISYSSDEPGRGAVRLLLGRRPVARLVFRAHAGRGSVVLAIAAADAGRLRAAAPLTVELSVTNGGHQTTVARARVTLV